ncbi:MAG: thiamine pyrophosphate-binding protein [Aeromicrobium sp.]|uniref:thiamine pyrophosphate-binding protein n=1 Tax=Aeromicrobium sp. TaxID=1871063 RepID=UPI0025BDA3B8|nr:thiamine pyrophosphate-binding protein [Aeromicrobium sp.]MCK5891471.1 thiamine pyrophosphate-binding protein [Aeromicrobium sp.]MDF1704712.1 thiamine pyrophosphate-binding protein [Aeromicrobium sp.]
MHVHEAIAHALADEGVDTMFGLMGDANLFLSDSFARRHGRFIAVAHEAGAVLAASGFSRAGGRVGVATVTHGPAVTNIVTPLVEAVRSRTPIVVVAGDTPFTDRDGLQNIDQRSVIAPTGAGFEQLRSAATLATDVHRAFRRARTERRPIVLNVPVDLQWQETEYVPAARLDVVAQPAHPGEETLDAALGVIASARRPVVLAGLGVRRSGARDAVLDLARRIGAPVATTLKARGLYAGEPEDLGIFGTLSDERTTDVLGQTDCVIVFGAALTKWTTAEGALLDGRRVVHVDTDATALNEHVAVDVPVVGDAGTLAAQMRRLLDEAEIAPTGFADRLPPVAEVAPGPVLTSSGTLHLHHVLHRLDAELPARRHLTLDCGRYFFHAAPIVDTGRDGYYLHTVEFGSIGLGLGTALGVAAVDPGSASILICGDGGFMLGGLTEFNTAVRHGLDVVVVVLNDGAYGAEHIQFVDRGLDPGMSEFDWPELADVATALGGTGFAVHTDADLTTALVGIEERTGPVLVNIHLDPHGITSAPH